MQSLRRFLIHRLGDKALSYLKMHGVLQANKHTPAAVWQPGGGRVLVLAPHMDDEIIGCGGALHRHVQHSAEITVVYLTDGRYGGKLADVGSESNGAAGPEQTPEQRPEQTLEKTIAQARRQEARAALDAIGIADAIFLDNADGSLAINSDAGRQVREIIAQRNPELVYLPFFLEEHPDHRAVNQILIDAVDSEQMRFECFGYEVWTPLFPNCLVDITDLVEVKRDALRRYRSQLAVNDYVHASLGLNAYRGIALASSQERYAEAFYAAPLDKYLELFRLYQSLRIAEPVV